MDGGHGAFRFKDKEAELRTQLEEYVTPSVCVSQVLVVCPDAGNKGYPIRMLGRHSQSSHKMFAVQTGPVLGAWENEGGGDKRG